MCCGALLEAVHFPLPVSEDPEGRLADVNGCIALLVHAGADFSGYFCSIFSLVKRAENTDPGLRLTGPECYPGKCVPDILTANVL